MKAFKNAYLTSALFPKRGRQKQGEGYRASIRRGTLCLILALVGGCGRPDGPSIPKTASGFSGADATSVVARVEGDGIAVDAFQKALSRRGPGTKKEALLEEMIRERALVAKAKAAGYDRDPEVVAAFERMIASRFEEEQLAKGAATQISDAEIEEAYHRDLARYSTPAAARAGVIFFAVSSKATPEARAEMKERAEVVLTEAGRLDATGYARLVQQHSEDQATRYKGGDTGWLIRRDELRESHWEPAVLDAVSSLARPGEIAPLVTTERGFYIVRLLDLTAASVQPLEQVKEGIRYQLTQRRQQQLKARLYDEAKRAAKIEINQAALDSISEPPMRAAQQPPPMPGG